jgi:hypothetical protein
MIDIEELTEQKNLTLLLERSSNLDTPTTQNKQATRHASHEVNYEET